jgi:hypothetical protein
VAWGVPKIGSAVAVSSGNLALTEPAGIASGDIMVACIAARDTAAFSLPSADWAWCVTQQSSGNTTTTVGSAIASGAMAWCRRAGSAPALTFTRTGGDVGLGRIIAYSGGLASGDALIAGSAETAAANTGSPSTPALDTTGNTDALLVAVFAGADNTTGTSLTLVAATDPTGVADDVADTTTAPSTTQWYIRSDDVSNLGGDTALDIGDAVKGTGGSTGTITYGTIGASSRHVVMAAAFKIAVSARVLDADAGGYTTTGTAASLEVGRQVVADGSSYTLTGQTASLELGRSVAADAAAYAVTGATVSLELGRLLDAEAASYAISGSDVSLEYSGGGRVVAAEAGSYALSGQDAALEVGRQVDADAGSYTITGQTVGLELGRLLDADAASYAITGEDAALDYEAADDGTSSAWKRYAAYRKDHPQAEPVPRKPRKPIEIPPEIIEAVAEPKPPAPAPLPATTSKPPAADPLPTIPPIAVYEPIPLPSPKKKPAPIVEPGFDLVEIDNDFIMIAARMRR